MEDEQQALPVGKRIARWIDERPGTVVAAGLLAVAIFIIAYWAIIADSAPPWTGFGAYNEEAAGPRAKTLWDWLGLLIVPAALAGGVYWLNRSQKETELKIAEKARAVEREIADNRQKQATLEAYYDRMTDLLLEQGLRESAADSGVRKIAWVRTVAVVKSLDGKRNGQLFAFLKVSKLMEHDLPIIDPTRIDFSEADLRGGDLREINLVKATLSKANLSGANLSGADLSGADLFETDLREVNLSGVGLQGAHLRRAKLHKASLRNADLSQTDLREASNWTIAQFDEAYTLQGATMPDGVRLKGEINDGPTYEEWKTQYLARQGEQ